MTILDAIIESTRAEVSERKLRASRTSTAPAGEQAAHGGQRVPGGQRAHGGLRAPGGAQAPGRLRAALSAEGIGVIAEIKRRSPSAGQLRAEVNVATIAKSYEQAGASALSVLTEGPHFGGSLDDLRAAKAACALPVLRKDFIVDPFQLDEAVAAGADAVLLIVAALAPSQLASLHGEAVAAGLDVLVEVHDERELEVAIEVGSQIIGVNNRDLRDFSVDVERTFALLERMPKDVLVVSESGIDGCAQLERLGAAGVDAVLVGEALMRAPDPGAALKRLRGLG